MRDSHQSEELSFHKVIILSSFLNFHSHPNQTKSCMQVFGCLPLKNSFSKISVYQYTSHQCSMIQGAAIKVLRVGVSSSTLSDATRVLLEIFSDTRWVGGFETVRHISI